MSAFDPWRTSVLGRRGAGNISECHKRAGRENPSTAVDDAARFGRSRIVYLPITTSRQKLHCLTWAQEFSRRLFEVQLGKWLFWRLTAIFVRGHRRNAFAGWEFS